MINSGSPSRRKRRRMASSWSWLFLSVCCLLECHLLVEAVRIDCDPCIDREAYTIQAIVHGTAGDGFWQQVERSMRQSAKDMRMNLVMELKETYSDQEMAQDIVRVAQSDEPPDALIVTIPSPVVESAIQEVIPLIPVFGLNSGYERARSAGLLGHVAMDEYVGGTAAAEEFLSHGEMNKVLFINHAKGNSAGEARFRGLKDRLNEEYQKRKLVEFVFNFADDDNVPMDSNSQVSVEEYVVDLAATSNEFIQNDLTLKMTGCPYDAVLLFGFVSFEALIESLKSSGCNDKTLLGTFDSDASIFDAIAVGDVAFAVSQQQHLQGSLSVALASIYATTGKTLAQSSESQFGVYISGPKIVNLGNLPTDYDANCEAQSFPVCDRLLLGEFVEPEERSSSDSNFNIPGWIENDRFCPCMDRSTIKIAGVLHADVTSRFWDVVYEQAFQAADDLGIEFELERFLQQESVDILHAKMASKIISLCQEGVDGIFVSIPSDKVVAAIEVCQALHVPIISVNSGSEIAEELGLKHHISQLEYEAGYGAGERLVQAGIKEVLCINIGQGNIAFDRRCGGFLDAVNASERNVTSLGIFDMLRDNAALSISSLDEFMDRDDDWEGVGFLYTGRRSAVLAPEIKRNHPGVASGIFDLGEIVFEGLKDDVFLFAIDQNPFVQGYMPVWLLTMMATTKQSLRNTFIESGPRFITQPPSEELLQCDEVDFKVCERPPRIILNDNLMSPGILAFGYLAVAISWACSLYFMLWMVRNRHRNIVQASQPDFLVLMCIGGIISSSTLVALSFEAGTNDDDTRASIGCKAAPFLYAIGWTLIFGSLCAKTFRLYRIMKNCTERKQEVVTFWSMIKIVVTALLVDLAIVIAWTETNPLVYERKELDRNVDIETGILTIDSVGSCTTGDDGPAFWAFAGPLVGVHLTLMIATNVLLYKVSGMKDRYQESKYIGFAMLLMLETLVVGVPIAVAVGDQQALHVVMIGVIAVHDIGVLCLVFVPKILFQATTESDRLHSREDSVILASLVKASTSQFGEAMDLLDGLAQPDADNGLTEKQRAQLRQVKTLLLQRKSDNAQHVPKSLFITKSFTNNFILREFAGVDSSERDTMSLCSKMSLMNGHVDTEKYTPPEFYDHLSEEQKRNVFKLLSWSNLKRWEFSIFDLVKVTGGNPLLFIGWAIIGSPHSQYAMAKACGCADDVTLDDFQGYHFVDSNLKIPMKKLCDYLRAVEADYNDANPYHNAVHAADVVQSLHTLIQMKSDRFTIKEELFSILLAAAVHDVKHPGKNNTFQVNAKTQVALVYNDLSVLENKHASHAFMLMLQKEKDSLERAEDDEDIDLNLLCNADQSKFDSVRKRVVNAVLDTDMSKHFARVNEIKGMLEEASDFEMDFKMRWEVLMYMLHLADISNPAKGDPLFKLWTDRCLEEFFAQGDIEAEMGLPISPNCDRRTTDKADCQIGFIKFVIRPAYEVLCLAIPEAKERIMPVIESNLKYWLEEKHKAEVARDAVEQANFA